MKVAVTTLVFCVAALLALGLVMLYSAGMTQVKGHYIGAQYLKAQLLWCALGFVVCVVVAALDYQILRKTAWLLYGGMLVLLAIVFVPLPHGLTHGVKGAHRWIFLPGFSCQPSEFAKIALIVMLAWYGDRYQRRMNTFKWGIIFPAVIVGAMLTLIFREPDRGTTILLIAVSGSMLLLAGVRWKFIIPPVVLATIGLTVSILRDPMRMRRIFSWLHPEETKTGVGYQAYNSMIALGNGGWFGLGLGNGREKSGGFVPENHTDFIFSVIGEELGLVATLLVVAAFAIIVFCGIYIAFRARDTFGTMLAAGITFLIGLQAVINIGVVTGALPNKGLALPFISYGGSSMLAMLACVGILLSVARHVQPSKISASDLVPDEKPARRQRNPFAGRTA